MTFARHFASLRANIIRTSTPETKPQRKSSRHSPRPTTSSAIPRSAKFTTSSVFILTTSIPQLPGPTLAAGRPEQADSADFPAEEQAPDDKASLSISADSTLMTCLKAHADNAAPAVAAD